MWQSVGLTVLVIVATLICVLLFMLFGKCSQQTPEKRSCSTHTHTLAVVFIICFSDI